MSDDRACELLVVDLDGTLLNSVGRVSPRNASALRAAERAGIPVVIATGRSWRESRSVLDTLNYRRPMIAAGGSVLSDGESGQTIHRDALPVQVVEDVVDALLRHDHAPLLLKDAPALADDYVVVGDGALDPASAWWFRNFGIGYRRVASIADDPHPEDTVRVGVVATGAALGTIAEQILERLGGRVFLQHWSAVTEREATGSQTHLLEVFNPRVSKWTMIERLCAQMQIDPRRTVTIGDGLNDVEMIANAGLGVAMANACPDVLARAGEVTAHHDEDGVAMVVDRLLAGTLLP